MEDMPKKSGLSRVFISLFDKQVNDNNKTSLNTIQEVVSLSGATILTIIGFTSKKGWGIPIAIVVAAICIFIYWGIQIVIDYIDSKNQTAANASENELTQYKKKVEALEKVKEKLTYENDYYVALLSETILLTDCISEANKARSTKALYTSLGSSIVAMTTCYSRIQKKDYSVHIYCYDDSTRMIRRLIVQSFVESKQKARVTDAISIDNPNIKKKYYAKVMLDEAKKISIFSNNEEIVSHLDFEDESEEIKNMFTQYAGMVFNVGYGIKLYVEVVSYNGTTLTPKGKNLEVFIQKVIAPFSSLMLSVNWEAIRGDFHDHKE